MSEAQALVYARDILMAAWKSTTRDESHIALDKLCHNPDLVIVLPSYENNRNLSVTVTYTTFQDLQHEEPSPAMPQVMSGWVATRRKSFKDWKDRFCVVADGVLRHYEHADPRPNGLRGQMVLRDVTLKEVKEKQLFVLQLVGKDPQERERQLSFVDESVYAEWKDAIQRAMDAPTTTTSAAPSSSTGNVAKQSLSPPPSPGRPRKNARRIIKGGVEGGFKAIKGASGMIVRGIRKNQMVRKASHSTTWTHPQAKQEEPPSVQVSIGSTRTYKIQTADPCGVEAEDTWVTVRAKTSQHFRLSGGEFGRLVEGDGVVSLEFSKGKVEVGPDDGARA